MDDSTQHLGVEERSRLMDRFGRSYQPGTALYEQGEAATECFILEAGRVRVTKKVRQQERNLVVLGPGDLLGEEALDENSRRSASAVAVSEVTALCLDGNTFGELMDGRSDLALRMLGQLVRRLRQVEEQLENTLLSDQPSRVVNTIVRLAEERGRSLEGYVIPISPLELSSRVGLDVEAVKRQIQQLRQGGYLEIADERVIVPELEPLRRLYELLGMKEEVRGGFP